ncbi:MAG: rhodanese-like domain-containing protein [Flavobacteriales bacterium]|jgi:rhodanese-related sulfurtransferase|nr:MAG: rhodanese-like domain-containing protein [Flavobacteriales bacterium]
MFRSLFGLGPKVDLSTILQQGATILDVRTPAEFAQGHVKGAVNIPLDQLQRSTAKVPKGKPVITCCLSGGRSGVAEGILRQQGFEAYNGGPWTNVNKLKG